MLIDHQQQEKKRIRRRERINVIITCCFVIVECAYLMLFPIGFFNVPALKMDSCLFGFFWFSGLSVFLILGIIVTGSYKAATFRRKHAWLSKNGIEVTATITNRKIAWEKTPSGDSYPFLCFQLSWSHVASNARVSIWKQLPDDVYKQLGLQKYEDEKLSDECMRQLGILKAKAHFIVLCDPVDPLFFLTINPIDPSKYPLPTPQGQLPELRLGYSREKVTNWSLPL